MTRERETDRTWCGKQKHGTKAKALAAAVAAKGRSRKGQRRLKGAKNYKGTGAKISVYRCQVCGSFHWGHRIKGDKHAHLKRRRD